MRIVLPAVYQPLAGDFDGENGRRRSKLAVVLQVR